MSRMRNAANPAVETRGPTLEAVAAAASVSVSTVSKVLNDRAGIASSTRDRVLAALVDAGYRKPGTRDTYEETVELVFGSLDGVWAIEIIRGASAVAREHGITVTVSETGVHHGVSPGWAAAVARRQPRGVVLIATALSRHDRAELAGRHVPFVVVDPVGASDPDLPSIGSTNWAGGVAATRHLLNLGHRRIGIVAGTGVLMATRARVAGFRSAMEVAGVPVDESLVFTNAQTEEASPDAALQLLDRPDRATAIFATSDVKALGVYEAARVLGLAVPGDVSVVGYDDLQFARWAGPPLTTIRQQLTEMAMEGVRMVLGRREDPERPVARIELATSLVVRDSTAAPREAS